MSDYKELTREERMERRRQYEVERQEYAERIAKRAEAIKAFADARGWRYKPCTVRHLIPGCKHDYDCRPPHDDHGYGFYQAGKGGKPVAYVSQPYDHANNEKCKAEMATWAVGRGLKVEFPAIESWWNNHCMVCVYTRDPTTNLWQAITRHGEKFVVHALKNLPFNVTNAQFIDPARHGDYIARYQAHAAQRNIRKVRTAWLFDPYTTVIIKPWCRGVPVGQLTADMIRAVVVGTEA